MSRIGSRRPRPETIVADAFRAAGVPFQQNVRRLPGTPDLVVAQLRLVVFVHGCFWHGCARHFRPPRTRAAFWSGKIAANRERDARVEADLRADGWAVTIVWEHEVRLRGAEIAARAAHDLEVSR